MNAVTWWVYTNGGIKIGEFGVMMSNEDFATANFDLVHKTFNLWCWQNNLSADEHNFCIAA